MTNTQKYLARLETDAWRTAGARFNASRRLHTRDWFATLSIALFSAINIGLVMYQTVYAIPASSTADNFLTVLSVSLGLFIIVISLIEWGVAGGKRADALQRNAEKLNEFHRELSQTLAEVLDGGDIESEGITALRKRYEAIKAKCPYNHEPIDDAVFVAKHRLSREFSNEQGNPKMNWLDAQWVKLRGLLASVWYFGVFWLVIGGLLYCTPWSSL